MTCVGRCMKVNPSSGQTRFTGKPTRWLARVLVVWATVLAGSACDWDQAGGKAAHSDRLALRSRPILVSGKRGIVVEGGTPRKGPVWVPSRSTLEAFEQAFPEQLGEDADRARQVDGYFRQYWGGMENGRHYVDVEFFESPPEGVFEKPVMMFDGGSYRASVRYFPDDGVLVGLEGGPASKP